MTLQEVTEVTKDDEAFVTFRNLSQLLVTSCNFGFL